MADQDPAELLVFAADRLAEAERTAQTPLERGLLVGAVSVVQKARLYDAYAQHPYRGEGTRLRMAEHAVTMWDVVRDLAQPFADHPDFRPEWRTSDTRTAGPANV